jgi:hypothetical protein
VPRYGLTAASVKRIKPPVSGQVDHFDRGFPGLALRVSYGGGKSWAFFYRIGGRLRRMTLGTHPAVTLAEARDAWREARLNVAAGRDPAKMKGRDKPTTDFENVAREWLKRDQSHNRSYHEVKRILEKEILPAWGHRQVDELGRRDILDLVDGIADRGAKGLLEAAPAEMLISVLCGLVQSACTRHSPAISNQINSQAVGGCGAQC